MRSAHRFYRLTAGLGALGLMASVLALGVALRTVDFTFPSGRALLAACQRLVPQSVDLKAILVLALAALGLLVLVRGGRSLMRQIRASRTFVGRQTVVGLRVIDGSVVNLVPDSRAQAFCAGLLRPQLYLSTGALDALSETELRAVLAHERHHLTRMDPLRILLARVLGEALFFLPVMRRLDARYAALAEIAADEAAARAHGAPTLASALLAFGESKTPAFVVGIAPERVDHLLGRGAKWRLPLAVLSASLLALVTLTLVAVFAATLTAGAGFSLAGLVMQTCTAVMVAAPVVVGVGLVGSLPSPSRTRRKYLAG